MLDWSRVRESLTEDLGFRWGPVLFCDIRSEEARGWDERLWPVEAWAVASIRDDGLFLRGRGWRAFKDTDGGTLATTIPEAVDLIVEHEVQAGRWDWLRWPVTYDEEV